MLSEEKEIFNLEVDEHVKNHMLEIARWGKFLAIFWLIIVILSFFVGAVMLFNGKDIDRANFSMQFILNAVIGTGNLLMPLVSFYPAYAMFKYAVLIKRSIQQSNQVQFTAAFAYMRKGLKYLGILTIATIALIAIGAVMTLIALSKQ